MKNCSNLYILSTIACNLAECLTEDELPLLATDLTALGDMLQTIIIRKTLCDEQNK